MNEENAFVHLEKRAWTNETNTPDLSFLPLGEALAETPEHIEWTWHGCIGAGSKTLFASKPKIGKSTTAFGLLRAMMDGAAFLGLTVKPTSVLLLSEEPASALREKAARFGLDLSFVHGPSVGGRTNTNESEGPTVHLLRRAQALGAPWPDVVDQAISYAVANSIGVLVIDTLDKWHAGLVETDRAGLKRGMDAAFTGTL